MQAEDQVSVRVIVYCWVRNRKEASISRSVKTKTQDGARRRANRTYKYEVHLENVLHVIKDLAVYACNQTELYSLRSLSMDRNVKVVQLNFAAGCKQRRIDVMDSDRRSGTTPHMPQLNGRAIPAKLVFLNVI
jgi:SPX domain protein involved in polyphosphate accumulation